MYMELEFVIPKIQNKLINKPLSYQPNKVKLIPINGEFRILELNEIYKKIYLMICEML